MTNSDDKILPLSQPLIDFEDALDRVSDIIHTNMSPVNSDNSTRQEQSHPQQQPTSQIFETEESSEKVNCPMCRIDVDEGVGGMNCGMCKCWYHRECLFVSADECNTLQLKTTSWLCVTCLAIRSNKVAWGEMKGEVAIKSMIDKTYREVVKWRKNLFMLPRGKPGTEFIKELTRLLQLFTNEDKKWSRLALSLVHIFIPLMLQKPSAKSKAKEHSKYLTNRLKLWYEGNIKSIMRENREIQKKLRQGQEKKKENKKAAFNHLMLLGKVGQAMKFINSEDDTRGVHSLTDEI